MARRFVTLDVFPDQMLASNPLAVVLGADGPDGPAMQGAATFTGVLMRLKAIADGTRDVAIARGIAMGWPGEIALWDTVEAGALRTVEVGGATVIVSESVLHV